MKGINIYIILLSLILINASHAYVTITWMPGTWLALIAILAFIAFILSYKKQFHYIKYAIIAYLLMSVSGVLAFGYSITAFSKFAAFLPVLTLFLLRQEDLQDVIKKINKIFAVIITISFSLFILKTLGVHLPSLGNVIYGEGFVYFFENHYYIFLDVFMYGAFTGFSLEAGYFSLLLICLLSINRFDFKKKSTWLYSICLLASLSLEGYLLFVIGLLLQKSLEKGNVKTLIRNSFITLALLAFIVVVAFSYNNGDNVLVEEILSRLAFDEDLGIVGNNRESLKAMEVIDDVFYSNQVWTGIGMEMITEEQKNSEFTAASGRVFIVVYGAIYTLIYFLLSVVLLRKTEVKVTLTFFVLFWLDFMVHGDLFTESMYLLIMFMLLNLKDKYRYKPDKEAVVQFNTLNI